MAATTTGSIVGTVTDPSGTIVAKAEVTVTNMDPTIAENTTNARGEFVITPLLVGCSSVACEGQRKQRVEIPRARTPTHGKCPRWPRGFKTRRNEANYHCRGWLH
jgi:hypothetical protein